MEKQLQNIQLLTNLLMRFHDAIAFTTSQLGMIRRYLFIELYPIPEFITDEHRTTLEYLKDVARENKLHDLRAMERYFEALVTEAEKDIEDSIKKSDKDFNIIAQAPFLYMNVNKDGYVAAQHTSNLKASFFILFDALCLEVYKNVLFEPGILPLLNHSYLKEEPVKPLLFSGSYHCITKIHAHHFTDIDTFSTIYIRNKKVHKTIAINELDQLLIAPHHGTHVNSCCHVLGETFTNRFDTHYDYLITRLSKEEPIFDENFKLHLIQWLLYFKLKNIESHQLRSCITDWSQFELSSYAGKFYDRFQELTLLFYENQFSDKNWEILKSPNGHSWLTTEDPGFSIDINAFISVHKPLQPDPDFKNLEKTSVIYFPLSKNYCLRIQPQINNTETEADESFQPIFFKDSTNIEFETINSMTVSTNKEMLISADKETLEKFALD